LFAKHPLDALASRRALLRLPHRERERERENPWLFIPVLIFLRPYPVPWCAAAGLPVLSDLPEGFSPSEERRGSGSALVLDFQSDEKQSLVDTAVGQLHCHQLLACARCKLWWMTPEWGSSAEDVPPETQFLLTEVEEGGPYAIILPLISQSTFRGTLRPPNKEQKGNSADHLFLRLESHNEDVTASHFKDTVLVQASWDLYDLVDEAVALAASLSGGSRPLREKQLPESLNVFGWCTWDAFYSKVSAKGRVPHRSLPSRFSTGCLAGPEFEAGKRSLSS